MNGWGDGWLNGWMEVKLIFFPVIVHGQLVYSIQQIKDTRVCGFISRWGGKTCSLPSRGYL